MKFWASIGFQYKTCETWISSIKESVLRKPHFSERSQQALPFNITKLMIKFFIITLNLTAHQCFQMITLEVSELVIKRGGGNNVHCCLRWAKED